MTAPVESARPIFPAPELGSERTAPWNLGRYVAWRLMAAVIFILLFLTVLFVVVEVLPGDPSRVLLPRGCSPVGCPLRDALVSHWGLNQPWPNRYLIFLGNMLTGNFGPSITVRPGLPIWDSVAAVLPSTLALVAIITLVLAVLSLPIGARLSRRKGGVLDQVVSFLLALAFAVPPLMLMLLGLYLFGVVFPILPMRVLPSPDPLEQLSSEVAIRLLPALIGIGTSLGLFAWLVRDYPLRSRADFEPLPPGEWRRERKSASSRIYGILPRFLAALPALFPWTLVAILLCEPIADAPGLGWLLWLATISLDYPMMAALVVVVGLLIVLPVVVVADILHYGMTRSWRRLDEERVRNFRVDLGDPVRWIWSVMTSVSGLLGLALILGVVVLGAAAPLIAGPYPTPLSADQPFLPPSPTHALGTSWRGYDVVTLLVYGGQDLPAVAAIGFALALAIGLAFALVLGFLGERALLFLTIPVDLLFVLSVPFMVLLLSVYARDSTVWGPALLGWPPATRIFLLDLMRIVPAHRRGEPRMPTLSERGSRSVKVAWGTAPLLISTALLATAFTVLGWALLGFLGLGPTGVVGNWGGMVSDAYNSLAMLRGFWWLLVPPILCIFVAALGPILLSLQMRRSYSEAPRIAVPISTGPPVVPAAPPGSNP